MADEDEAAYDDEVAYEDAMELKSVHVSGAVAEAVYDEPVADAVVEAG